MSAWSCREASGASPLPLGSGPQLSLFLLPDPLQLVTSLWRADARRALLPARQTPERPRAEHLQAPPAERVWVRREGAGPG